MTERLYFDDAYLTDFTATVISCEQTKKGYAVTLDKSAFFPEGGGQPYDLGTIGGVAVIDVQEKDGEVYHYCEQPVEAGSEVECCVDFARRFLFMQLHTGEHIFSGFIHALTELDNVGFHIGSENVTVDFNGPVTEELLLEAERYSNEVIWKNVPVKALYPSKDELPCIDYRSKKEIEGQVRLIEVPGADLCACCGTHVKLTGEIGMIKAVGMMNYKSGVRITLQIGMRALDDYTAVNKAVHEASALLSAKPLELSGAIEKLYSQLDEKKAEIAALNRKINAYICQSVPENSDKYCVFIDSADANEARNLCDALCEKVRVGAVFALSGENCKYCVGSRNSDVREIGKMLNTEFNGRGGGRPEMVQGSFTASRESIENFWNSL